VGKILLAKKEAGNPYEVEELDLRLYSMEELCYYLFHNVPLIGDDFIDERLMQFIEVEVEEPEIREKIERFYKSPADLDNTLVMLLSEVSYFNEQEIQAFQRELMQRRKKNTLERMKDKADVLLEKKRYMSALKIYRPLIFGEREARIGQDFYVSVLTKMANAYGHISSFAQVIECLELIYDETHEDGVIEKMFSVAKLSGCDVPEVYFSKIPDSVMNVWRQRYVAMEGANKSLVDESPVLNLFFGNKEEQERDLRSYVDFVKEKYRKMLE